MSHDSPFRQLPGIRRISTLRASAPQSMRQNGALRLICRQGNWGSEYPPKTSKNQMEAQVRAVLSFSSLPDLPVAALAQDQGHRNVCHPKNP
jgi:hypothetical protein